MTMALLGLMAGFMLVLIMLFLLLLRTDLGFIYKLLALVLVTLFFWVQYESLQQYTGWPSSDDLPQNFILVATDIQEPNKKTGEQGVMYWWVRDGDHPQRPPRVFRLPYQADMHQQTEQIIQDQEKGSLYRGRKARNVSASRGQGISFEKISKAGILQKK